MRRLAFMLAACGLVLGVSAATASVIGTRTEIRLYEHLNTPPEATTAAAGGLGVAATDEVKSRVRVEFSGGAPCGPLGPDDGNLFGIGGGRSGGEAGGMGVWLPVGIGVGAVAGLAAVGFFLLRRSKV